MTLKYIIGGAIIISLMASSCKKDNLFLAPVNSISQSDAFSTADRIEKSSVGMYDALQNANFFSGRILIYADMRGLDVTPNTYFGNMGFYSTTNSTDGTVASAYQAGYRTIYQSNLFLKGFAPNASLVSQAKADQYTGEAKFIRSLCYFYLVNLWAQPYNFTADASHAGVPLVLTAADDPFDPSNNLPRSTVKQVYDQMEADLLEAETKLPLTAGDAFTKTARATKGAARGLLMRLYLYKGDYVKANTYADLIMSSNQYSLNPGNPLLAFRNYTTPESIFSVAMSGADNPNTNNSLGQHYNPRARGDLSITPAFLALMDTGVDLRFRKITSSGDSLVEKYNGSFWTRKYNGLTTDYVPVLRYDEVLLSKAEALAKTNTAAIDPTALMLLNQVRTRSNAAPVVPVTRQDLLDAIVKERRIELAFEGQGSLEFQRNKLDIPVHSTVPAQAWGTSYRVLPIPKYETDKDPNLVQNTGY